MALFAMCVSGWEEYRPIWFTGDGSINDFKIASKKAIDKIVRRLAKSKNSYYIDGDSILDVIVPEMSSLGFNKIVPEIQIDLEGEGPYMFNKGSREKRPDIFDDETWRIVTDHNEKIDKRMYDEYDVTLNKE